MTTGHGQLCVVYAEVGMIFGVGGMGWGKKDSQVWMANIWRLSRANSVAEFFCHITRHIVGGCQLLI